MMYLYTLQNCGGCEVARNLLKGEEFKEIPIDNPLVEVGIQVWFKDGRVHAPVLVKPNDGIYFLVEKQFVLIKNLRVKNAASN